MIDTILNLNWSNLKTVPLYAAGFYAINKLIAPKFKPSSVASEKSKLWNNIFTSLIHSSITGIGTLLAIQQTPELLTDLFGTTSNTLTHLLGKLSTGYFIYDTFDMINDPPVAPHLMVHHAVVIGAFGSTIIQPNFHGFLAAALLMEVNSVFLHIRQLMNTAKCERNSRSYRIIKHLNFSSFLSFRFFVNIWMAWSCWNSKGNQLSDTTGIIGIGVMMIFMYLNTDLFWSLLKSDVLKKNKKVVKNE